jgi:hypothetical protein
MPKSSKLKKMTDAELMGVFHNGMAEAADGLRQMAPLWCELRERGEDMSDYDGPYTPYLSAIAAGELDALAVLIWAGVPGLVDAVGKMAPEDQAKLCRSTTKIPVLTAAGIKPMWPVEMSEVQINQVFGGGTIRTPAEQSLPPV